MAENPVGIPPRTFIDRPGVSLANGCVNIDGQPTFIYSGELIPYRLPASLWKDRLEKLKAGSLNSVSAYFAWNFHCPSREKCDFTSPDRNIREFLTLARDAGLHAIVRPGPYVCNEWDLGGYPAWLLTEESGDWRTGDPSHLQFCRQWFRQIHREFVPFQQDRGGPIILEQIENEHRWNASNFLGALCNFAREDGITVPLIGNHDGGGVCVADHLTDGCDIYTGTLEFYRWRGWLESHQRRIGPDKPLMVLEYRCGDGQEWGGAPIVPRWDPIHWYISQDRLFMALGANVLNHFVGAGGITPVGFHDDARPTSYGDNAPISPWGQLNPLFYEMRLLGEFIQSFNAELVHAQTWPIGWGTDNCQVECLARRSGEALFLFTANHSNLAQDFRITLPHGRTLPDHGHLSLEPYRTQVLLADAKLSNGLHLRFCTHQIMKAWHEGNITSLVIYGPVGTEGYLDVAFGESGVRVPLSFEERMSCQTAHCGIHQVKIYVASRETAERIWFFRLSDGTIVPISGNLDLMRWQPRPGEPASGELPLGRALDISFPALVESVQVDGRAAKLDTAPGGLKVVHMALPELDSGSITLGEPSVRAETAWERDIPTKQNGWNKAVAWGKNAKVLLEPSTYEWIKQFDVVGCLPKHLEFLGIASAEIEVYLNGMFLGVYPERRSPGTNDRRSFNAIFNVNGVIREHANTLAVRMTFPGRHNSGQPIYAGFSHPVVLRCDDRGCVPLPRWKVSGISERKWLVKELDGMSGPPEGTDWTWIDLAAPNLHRHSCSLPHWREVRWYQAELNIPPALQNRPLFLECPPVEEAWLYGDGRCLGHTRMATSSTFDLSELAGRSNITLTLAVRHNWYATPGGIGLAAPPRLVTADQALDADWWFRPGSEGLRMRWFTQSAAPGVDAVNWLPVTSAASARRLWYRQAVRVKRPAGLIAPLYVELGDFEKHATIYWNSQPIGLYASIGPQKRFFVPDDQVRDENQLVISLDGYDGPARIGSVKAGYYYQARPIKLSFTGGQHAHHDK